MRRIRPPGGAGWLEERIQCIEEWLREAESPTSEPARREILARWASARSRQSLLPSRIAVKVDCASDLQPAKPVLVDLTLLAAAVWNFHLPKTIQFVYGGDLEEGDLDVLYLKASTLGHRAGQFNPRSHLRTGDCAQGSLRVVTDVVARGNPFALDPLEILALAMHEMGHYLYLDDHDVKPCVMHRTRLLGASPDPPSVRLIGSLISNQALLSDLRKRADALLPNLGAPIPSRGESAELHPIPPMPLARALRQSAALLGTHTEIPLPARTLMLLALQRHTDEGKLSEAELMEFIGSGLDSQLVRRLLAETAHRFGWETEFDHAREYFCRYPNRDTAVAFLELACEKSGFGRARRFLMSWRALNRRITPLWMAWINWSENSCMFLEVVAGETLELHSSLVSWITLVIGRVGVGVFRVALALDRLASRGSRPPDSADASAGSGRRGAPPQM